MVIQVIQEKRRLNTGQKAGKAIGGALSSLASSAVNKGMEDLENESIQRETGANLQGIRDPQARSAIMQDQMKRGQKYRQALASHELQMNQQDQYGQPDISGQQAPQRGQNFQEQFGQGQRGQRNFQERLQQPGIYDQEREPEPVIRESQYEEEPKKKPLGAAKETGQRRSQGVSLEPQTETGGKKFQRKDPLQVRQRALELQQASLDTPNPLMYEEAENIVLNNENNIGAYNQGVELERQQKQAHQRDYGSQAVASMEKLMPKEDVTDEHRAYFQRLGEEAARNGENESDFQKKISKEAFKFKDDLANIQKSFPSARIFNKIKGGFYGNTRKAEEEKADIKIKLKPLLEKGLYNTARKFLAKADFFPEEAESLIADLSETTNKNLSKLPNLSKTVPAEGNYLTKAVGKTLGTVSPVLGAGLEMLAPKDFTPENLSLIENNMRDIFANDPNTNLILLRKAYEDKGVDWRTFKNLMNKMVLNGEIKLNDDQMSQFNSNIDSPPEGYLDLLLRKSGLIGR